MKVRCLLHPNEERGGVEHLASPRSSPTLDFSGDIESGGWSCGHPYKMVGALKLERDQKAAHSFRIPLIKRIERDHSPPRRVFPVETEPVEPPSLPWRLGHGRIPVAAPPSESQQ